MPGVDLDFLPASQPPEALGSPDSACAESGLEEVIGELLALEEAEDEAEKFDEEKFESTLRCAVGEIHGDLQAFGKQVDVRLEKASAQVAPLAEAVARLQEENLRLRIQQERMVRQVEALCQVMGLPDLLHELHSKESLNSVSRGENVSSSDTSSSKHLKTAAEAPHDTSPCAPQESPSCSPEDTPACTLQSSQSSVPQEPISCPKDSPFVSTGSETPQKSPSPVPHSPTFATRRSLSAPSLTETISSSDSTVPRSVNCPNHDPILIQMSRLKYGNASGSYCYTFVCVVLTCLLTTVCLS